MTVAATLPETITNAELIWSAFEILNTHDVAALKQFGRPKPWSGSRPRRASALTRSVPTFQAAFDALPDFHIQVVGLAAPGNDVFVQWRMTGTHSGAPWQGIAPTGRVVELDGMDHFVLRDGKVTARLTSRHRYPLIATPFLK